MKMFRTFVVALMSVFASACAHAQYSVVLTTGTQTIYGSKSFNDYLIALGVFQLGQNGSSSVAALSWTSDPDTGLRRPGADIVGLQAGGILGFQVSGSSVTIFEGLFMSPGSSITTSGAQGWIVSGSSITTDGGMFASALYSPTLQPRSGASNGLTLTANAASGSGSNGGAITATGGTAGSGNGDEGGRINLTGGSSQYGHAGGNLLLKGGTVVSGAAANGGNAELSGGNNSEANSSGESGGSVVLTGGRVTAAGSTATGATLTVGGGSGVGIQGNIYLIPGTGGATQGLLGIGTTSPSTAFVHISSAGAAGTATVMKVSTGTAAGQELMVVMGSGKIGIGMTNPSSKVHITGGDGVKVSASNPADLPGFLTETNYNWSTSRTIFQFNGDAYNAVGGNQTIANMIFTQDTATTGRMDIGLKYNSTFNTPFSITSSGFVGIGNTNPSQLFEVANGTIAFTSSGYGVAGCLTAVKLRNTAPPAHSASKISFAYNCDDFDQYTSTGATTGQWRNTRTGLGP